MSNSLEDLKHVKRIARIAGVLYLIGPAPFGLLYVSSLIVPGNATATVHNILASESLVRLSIASNLLSQITFIFASLALYLLFKPVNKNMAALMVLLNLVGTPITMLNDLNQLGALLVLHSADSLKAFTPDQVHAQVLLFLDLRANGLTIAQLFWGLWLFPMGYLVFKSGFLPRIIGPLLMIACFAYLIQSSLDLLLPNNNVNLILYIGWVEILLPLYLLIMGVNAKQWQKRALAFA
ncbi:MAG TPA: DUF4386 domain-containing protein [Ktedonosporobacter sp.]|nr:DUF4386 domain-containing protein [Ktedonosporobacter sp.]